MQSSITNEYIERRMKGHKLKKKHFVKANYLEDEEIFDAKSYQEEYNALTVAPRR
jgi:hypothetical protein